MEGVTTETRAGPGTEAFERLYRNQRDRLRRVAYLMTGQAAVAEELVQDAFVPVHQRWSEIDQPVAYLRTTLVNLCLAWKGRSAMGREREPRTVGWVEQPEIDETWARLAELPHDQRVVLVLRYYEDMTIGDIAAMVGVLPATVRTRIHRALEKLRKEMSP
jgi:RNA polymerase sigma factor (sigma-70 family)